MTTSTMRSDLDRSLLIKLNDELERKITSVKAEIRRLEKNRDSLKRIPLTTEQIDRMTYDLFTEEAYYNCHKKNHETIGKLLAQKRMSPPKADSTLAQENEEKAAGVTPAELHLLRSYCARQADKEMAVGLCALIDKTSPIQAPESEDKELMRLLAEFCRLHYAHRRKVEDLPTANNARQKTEDPIDFQLAKKLGFEFIEAEVWKRKMSDEQYSQIRKYFGSQTNYQYSRPEPGDSKSEPSISDAPIKPKPELSESAPGGPAFAPAPAPAPASASAPTNSSNAVPTKREPTPADPLLSNKEKSDSSEAEKTSCIPCIPCRVM